MVPPQPASRGVNGTVRMKRVVSIFAVGIVCLVAFGGEAPDRMTGLRIPQYKNGRLAFELRAQTGVHEDAKHAGELGGITILMYESLDEMSARGLSAESLPDTKPPLKLRIRADKGSYDINTQIAVLKGNVELERFIQGADPQGGAPSLVKDARLTCDQAKWDNLNEVLSAPGTVTLDRGGDILKGEDLTYYRPRLDEKRNETLQIEKNVQMQIHPQAAPEKAPKNPEEAIVRISCAGSALYDFLKGVITFSDKVVARQHGMALQSARLRISVLQTPANSGKESAPRKASPLDVERSVSQIQAWESVTVTGPDVDGRGDQAVYDRHTGMLVLTGQGGRLPEMMYLGDRIRDETIVYDFINKALTASGQGENHRGSAWLRNATITDAAPASNRPAPMETLVTYTDRLRYDREHGKAVFTGAVTLKRSDMELFSDRLEATIPTEEQSAQSTETGVRRVTAEGNVAIKTVDGRQVTAGRATLDTRDDVLRFSGRPVPAILDPGRSQITAPEITIIQVRQSETEIFSIVRAEGSGEAKFVEKRKTGGDEGGGDRPWWNRQGTASGDASDTPEQITTRVLFEGNMDFDESQHLATFKKNVVLTRGDLVVKSGELEVGLDENLMIRTRPVEGIPTRKIIARKEVQLHASGWNAASDRLVHILADKTITLLGNSSENAKIWEDRGSSLNSPRIVFNQELHSVDADGPGDLLLAESDPVGQVTRSFRISWTGSCTYSGPEGAEAEAVFRRGVSLEWQDMVVRGNQLQLYLGTARAMDEVVKDRDVDPTQGPSLLKGRMRRAEMRDTVRLDYAGRHASGDLAIVERDDNTISLSGENGAELSDERGLRLLARDFVFYQAEGRMYATGPGTLYIAGTAAESIKAATGGEREKSPEVKPHVPGTLPQDYTMSFERDMAYNLVKHQIVFRENVSISQETLTGRCDALEVLMGVNPVTQVTGEAIAGLVLMSAECVGGVYFRRLEPPANGEDIAEVLKSGPEGDRPGRTVLLQSDRAMFYVQKGIILFNKRKSQVRILEQMAESAGVGRDLRRTRQMISCDEAILDRNTGNVTFKGNIRNAPIPPQGPLRFPD